MTTALIPGRPAAALWDMDGTIINSEPLWLRTERAMLERFGLSMPDGMETELVGVGLTDAARKFQALGVPMSVQDIVAEWADGVVAGLAAEQPNWMPGALELLAEFRELGVPNALVTMSVRRIADAVVALLPEGTFAAIVAGDEVEHEKPHPDPYLRGAAALGVESAACIAFEDSRPGCASAAAAGCVVIGTPGHVPLIDSAAHEELPTLAGLDATKASAIWLRHRQPTEENN